MRWKELRFRPKPIISQGPARLVNPQTAGLSLDSMSDGLIKEGSMPVQRGRDSKGPYYQWGDSGKKYHYTAGNKEARLRALRRAKRQGRAARASGYNG